MLPESVILVNEQDEELGVMEKLEAHQKGLLHRALSVFIFNDQDELLLQRRALSKYHSAGLWTNTCCSHPRPGEAVATAAVRRLKEEMGITCELTLKTTFIYRTAFDNGLTEHELDYVFTGKTNKNPEINLEEAEAFEWKTVAETKQDLVLNPGKYTSWFKIAITKFF